jgi:diguanylate cyclase (GGDEF)-like protein/PAS domain S-box-containing protein
VKKLIDPLNTLTVNDNKKRAAELVIINEEKDKRADELAENKQTEIALRESHAQAHSLLNSMVEGAYGVDMNGNCTFVNQSFLNILGYENADEVMGKYIHGLIHYSRPDGGHYPAKECRMYAAYQRNEEINVDDEVFWRKDGTSVQVVYWSAPIVTDGVMMGAIATFMDITERKKAEAALKEAALYARSLLEASLDSLVTISFEGKTTDINAATEKVTGVDRSNLIGSDFSSYFTDPEKARKGYEKVLSQGSVKDYPLSIRHVSGDVTDVLYNASVYRCSEGKVLGVFAAARDMTERKKLEEEVRQLAFYDTLTNLPNRRLLNDRLSQIIASSKRTGHFAALMFLDLDNFKPLNDTHGHDVGDMLLIEAANRLTSYIREMDTVARFGGDEFVVMLSELDADKAISTTQAAIVAEKIRAALSEPYQFSITHEGQADKTVEHRCTGSIGVVMFNGSEGSQDDLMKWADVAMYEAKDAGRNQIKFYGEKI